MLFRSSRRKAVHRVCPNRRFYSVDSQRPPSEDEGDLPEEKIQLSHSTPTTRYYSGQVSPEVLKRLYAKPENFGRVVVKVPLTPRNSLDQRELQLDCLQLRDACTCPRCVDPHSKQRYFQFGDIPSKVEPRSLTWDGDNLVVQWENDIPGFDESHVSTYHVDNLPYNGFTGFRNKKIRMWDKKLMEQDQHWITHDRYMNDQTAFTQAMRKLAHYGLIFVKDIPDSREEVEKIATRMGPLRNSFYGSTWDVRSVPKAKNVAYTNQNLGLHMDLLYMREPPGYQLLHCLRNSCEGGESVFVDSFGVASSLKQHTFDLLSKWEVNYHYQHEDQAYHASRPVFELARHGSRILEHVNYSPPFQAPFTAPQNDPGWSPHFRKFHKAYQQFSNALTKERRMFQLKLNPGECVIFENRRVLHARRAFDTNSGERWLAGAYVDEDAVVSRFAVLDRDRPPGWESADFFEPRGRTSTSDLVDG